ncbi:RNA polymerase sigma factor [Pseudochrobactrum sp. sp1633]|uniref:RNA polymerase sigma factor n=1 Tax=Pseudochrobactrum sp. sp1633 TaxID=3036706 RepID=UPI0025A672BC|nr:RNA polymerase sigma factor [Pseudochrobactrum sp. sp1633]MDM8346639.1 RNA polymerase sigma factor [Pseudochrobactrum sp. sp1633]HWD13985.1 RNA polymerase sigma factor [Pseudochrobactrum sp.]
MNIRSANNHEELMSAYLRQLKWLRDMLKRRTRSHELADDALQETWLRLTKIQDKTCEVRDHRAFILRVANNIAIDLLRKEQRHYKACLSDEEILKAVADSTPSPEIFTIDRDQLRQLVLALLQLPEKPRTALLLARCDCLTHYEIAQRLGVSESMVARYLAQALRHCRDHFRGIS